MQKKSLYYTMLISLLITATTNAAEVRSIKAKTNAPVINHTNALNDEDMQYKYWGTKSNGVYKMNMSDEEQNLYYIKKLKREGMAAKDTTSLQ